MVSRRDDINRQVAIANRILPELGLATGVLASSGHASMRDPKDPDRFVVKGRGYEIDALSLVAPEGMVVCDLDGFKVDGPPGITQPFEVMLHSAIYKARPDVQSVVHVHPRYAVAMSVLGIDLVPMCNEGLDLVEQPLPLYPHNTLIVAEEDGAEVAALLGNGKAILLQGHGAITVGGSLDEAVLTMAYLEEQAKMNWYAVCAAGANHPRITAEQITERRSQPGPSQLPHFADANEEAVRGVTRGVWRYYESVVSEGI